MSPKITRDSQFLDSHAYCRMLILRYTFCNSIKTNNIGGKYNKAIKLYLEHNNKHIKAIQY